MPRSARSLLGRRRRLFDDEPGRRVEDPGSRAVVALERDDPRAREVLVEPQDVLDLRPAPPVDRLVLVPHRAERVRAAPEELDEGVLARVRVLVLVDQEVPHPRGLRRRDRGLLPQEAHGAHDQVVEVEGAGGRELPLVEEENTADPLSRVVRLGVGVRLRGDERVLRVGDAAAHRAGRQDLLGDSDLVHRLLDERELIRRVRDREPRRKAGDRGVAPEEAQGEGVKGSDEGDERSAAQDPAGPFAHFLGGLVRERDRDDRARVDAGFHQTRQAVRDDPRLARARAGENEERPLLVEDRRLLLGIEALECGRFVHDRNLAELTAES